MKTRFIAAILAVGFVLFAGAFIWATVRPSAQGEAPAAVPAATATLSEVLSDGRIEAQVFALGNRDIQLDLKFLHAADGIETADMRPSVNFAMVQMHMDGIEPPLQPIAAGVWRVRFRLPMAGRWVVNVGMGEEFAEVEFNAD